MDYRWTAYFQSLGGTWNYANFSCRFEMQKCVSIGAKSIPKLLPVLLPINFPSLSWPELVNAIIGNLEQQERTDSWDLESYVGAVLKRAFVRKSRGTHCQHHRMYVQYTWKKSTSLFPPTHTSVDHFADAALTLTDLCAVNTSFFAGFGCGRSGSYCSMFGMVAPSCTSGRRTNADPFLRTLGGCRNPHCRSGKALFFLSFWTLGFFWSRSDLTLWARCWN
jgi:hypothetical protein